MGPLGAPIFSPTVEKSSLPGLDFTSPCGHVIVMEEVVELFSSEGNFFCKVIFRLLFNTKALLCLG